jgi:hypothetical protein
MSVGYGMLLELVPVDRVLMKATDSEKGQANVIGR